MRAGCHRAAGKRHSAFAGGASGGVSRRPAPGRSRRPHRSERYRPPLSGIDLPLTNVFSSESHARKRATSAGAVTRVDYTATYAFFTEDD